jgi:hypothetical protein
VTFTAGSVNLGSVATDANGDAAVTSTSLTPGTYSVIASFTGQPGSSPSQSTPVSVTITQVPTTLTLSPNPGTAALGSPVTLTTLVQYVAGTSLHPTGTITIKDGSTTLATLSLEDGSASFTTSSLTAGTHSLTATYSGDANFVKSSSNATVTITNP